MARIATTDEAIHRQAVREVLLEAAGWDMSLPAPLLSGRIPIDPRIVGCGDVGSYLLEAHPESPSAQSYFSLADHLHEQEDLWSGPAAAAPASREVLQ
jgi:hypothetical protein